MDENDYGFQLFDGLKYQEALEEKAYHLAGGYQACVQLAKDYIEGKPSHHFEQVQPSYAFGYKIIDLNTLFSPEVNQALKEALLAYENHGAVPAFVSYANKTSNPIFKAFIQVAKAVAMPEAL